MKNLIFDNFAVFSWVWIVITAILGVAFFVVFFLILFKLMLPVFKRTSENIDDMMDSATKSMQQATSYDVECPYCETIYKNDLSKCPTCGAPRQDND